MNKNPKATWERGEARWGSAVSLPGRMGQRSLGVGVRGGKQEPSTVKRKECKQKAQGSIGPDL